MKKIFFLIIILIPYQAYTAQSKDTGYFPTKTFSVFFENDTFFNTDREYTNGIRLSMTYNSLPEKYSKIQFFMDKIKKLTNLSGNPGLRYGYSLSLGQNIYTPENTEAKQIVKDERPYSGLTYLGTGITAYTDNIMTTLEFSAGIIGPLSLADKTQKEIHRTFDWNIPQGWDNQLNNEPFAGIFYSRRWKAAKEIKNGFGFDLIPEFSAGAGNALTYMEAGVSIRAGYNIPNDFGTPRIRPTTETNFPLDYSDPRLFSKFRRYGIYAFCSANSQYVLRNIFLDGNTFENSHSVDKYPVTGTTTVGIGIILHRFNIVYGHVFNTKSYKGQKEKQYYGTLSISYSW